ncbi:MAG: hypothetical protein M1820_010458 [Bogoriella megaspora]|nr:MAG: hypothetical protein M1820_010458 [Bogoriella megaspora]
MPSPQPMGTSRAISTSLIFRPSVFSIVKLLHASLVHIPAVLGAPLSSHSDLFTFDENIAKSPDDGSFWAYIGIAIALVLLGGAFAGLTIALMGQDEIYLQVIKEAGEGAERKQADAVLRLLNRGKHWVLVTLLLSNVITNETLPIILDRSIGGGWPAVLSSTVLIVIFGEIAPQSVCVRYGLPIGAFMSPFVLILMWILAPVAWPTAKLLDWILGEDHGTIYKKAGLKTLVTLHRTMGQTADERLSQDEVTIISAVLDLKQKPVGNIMTPMNDVFTMSADTVLDEKMMDTILSAGYSRIPIYHPENPRNFVGMLLVKILITYDPEDCLRVRDFALATLPETSPKTSCLDIVNFFQEGKSHMVLVSDFPGESYGALGVVTLEDVIEELIGEEIIDESDVFVDVHKAIRRMAPAPRTKMPKNEIEHQSALGAVDELETDDRPRIGRRVTEGTALDEPHSRKPSLTMSDGGRATTFLMRRKSSTGGEPDQSPLPVPIRGNTPELRERLRHLGPSNVASRPRQTKFTNVKIKPGVGTIPENPAAAPHVEVAVSGKSDTSAPPSAPSGGVGEGLLSNSGLAASGAVQALNQGYGTMALRNNNSPLRNGFTNSSEPPGNDHNGDGAHETESSYQHDTLDVPSKVVVEMRPPSQRSAISDDNDATENDGLLDPDQLGELRHHTRTRSNRSRGNRSGSITENVVEQGGVKKIVLEFAGSDAGSDVGSDNDGEGGVGVEGEHAGDGPSGKHDNGEEGQSAQQGGDADGGAKKKKKKRSKKKGKKSRSVSPEKKPLLR